MPSPTSTAPLRVALLAGSLTQGGAEKQFVYMARALRDRGVQVRVYSLTRGEHYESVLAAAGLPPIWIGRWRNPLVRSLMLAKLLRGFRPHIVQAGHFFTNLHVTLAARMIGAQAVGSLRNDALFEVEANGVWGQWLLRIPPALLANSSAAGRNVARMGIRTACIHVLENVVDLEAFDRAGADGQARSETGEMCAALVCRLVPAKRVDRFLRALALARSTGCKVRGLIVGDGPERRPLEAQAHSLGLARDAIHFCGRRDDVPALLRQADALVVTSDHEGTPNVVLEAMAATLPVVTTPAGDAARIVQEGVTGFVVPFDDDAALADRLARLAASPELRRRMGDAGRSQIVARHTEQGLGEALVAVYRAIAAESHNSRLAYALA
jgi:glycosyltransferase involved in cell wall biosynthesis